MFAASAKARPRAGHAVALVENGSRPGQRVVTGTQAPLAARAAAHAVRSPALLILGEVATLADTLAWFGAPPVGATIHDTGDGGTARARPRARQDGPLRFTRPDPFAGAPPAPLSPGALP